MRITVAAPAKVNLWLRVGDRRRDGFHDLDTLYCGLDLADTLMVRAGSDGAPLETSFAPPLRESPALGPPEANLAVRAADAFLERGGLKDRPSIRLIKRIPTGAGLGGGSSDAAAVLRAMTRLHPGVLGEDELLDLAAGLGSDVPFFVLGQPLTHGTGRGETVAPLPALPSRPVVLVMPPLAVPTPDAYGWVDDDRDGAAMVPGVADAVQKAGGRLDWDEVIRASVNDFEEPVFRRHPVLREIRDGLQELGARPALLAGSGSTVFGIFHDEPMAVKAAEAMRSLDNELRVTVTATRTR